MANEPLRLTRDQLAQFLPDHEAIRRFERLFSVAEAIAPDVVNEVSTAAESAGARATEAMGQVLQVAQGAAIDSSEADRKAMQALDALGRIADALEILAQGPQPQPLVIPDIIEPAPTEFPPPRYGAFYDTTTQTPAAINTAYAITLNTTDVAFGVYRGATTSQIFITSPGVYNIQFSAQLDNTSAGNHIIYIWLRVNGVDVANSASQVRLKGTDAELVAAWNFAASLKAGDYFQLMYSATDVSVQILAQAAAAPVPAIPSVILTVQEVSK